MDSSRQGRLAFSSNLRLLNSTGGLSPNSWFINLIFTMATVVAYASASLFFTLLPGIEGVFSSLSVCVVPGIFLGVSVLIMALIAVWSLLATRIPTWSSSPMHTVLAAMAERRLERQPD